MRGNKPIKRNDRIVIDDPNTKEKLIEMSEKRNESIKSIVVKLIEKEYDGIGGGNERDLHDKV